MGITHVKYLIVGGGLAGSTAAEAIRRRDPAGGAMLVGLEVSRPYNRPPLSREYLLRRTTRSDLTTHPIGWFVGQQVQLRTATRVTHVDVARRCVTLNNAEEVAFDTLLIATGSGPKPLRVKGADLPNVFHLRTIEDADRILHAMDQARAEGRPHPADPDKAKPPARGRAVVVGAGLLGVDLACTLTEAGLHVDLVTRHPHVWRKFAGESAARLVARYLESKHVTVHVDTLIDRLDGDGRVQRVVLSDGRTIETDLVIPALGSAMNRDILRGTPIAAEKAILVDEGCRTNLPGVFAAGDCAAVFDPAFGKHCIRDHWENARVTGEIAGANMAGEPIALASVNTFGTTVFDLPVTAWGEGRFVDHRLTRGSVHGPEKIIEFGLSADGRLAQVIAVGQSEHHGSLRELVARRAATAGFEERLKDPAFDLDTLI